MNRMESIAEEIRRIDRIHAELKRKGGLLVELAQALLTEEELVFFSPSSDRVEIPVDRAWQLLGFVHPYPRHRGGTLNAAIQNVGQSLDKCKAKARDEILLDARETAEGGGE